ncbi:MAG: NAD(P)H-dependent oxidoreductase [Desulfobacterales bacterium]|jgi:multimeric flavodoxin WrbA/protein-tyrosine-phosphatase
MFVLGLQGSPRRKGNSAHLLSVFLGECERLGARIEIVDVTRDRILPCAEYVVCEKKGFCPIDDDMKQRGYPLLRAADVVVAATPIFFYNCTSQLKALIDRSQTLWARRYRLKLADPNSRWRRGFVLSVAATHGKQLFDGLHLTMQYFFDAISAQYHGSLTYRGIEKAGDMARHETVQADAAAAAADLLAPYLGRQKLLFVSGDGAARSQIAAAFARVHAGDRIEVRCAGLQAAEKICPAAAGAMRDRGIDVGFLKPEPLDRALEGWQPEAMVTVGKVSGLPALKDARIESWDFATPDDEDAPAWRQLAGEIEERVRALTESLQKGQ